MRCNFTKIASYVLLFKGHEQKGAENDRVKMIDHGSYHYRERINERTKLGAKSSKGQIHFCLPRDMRWP